MKKRILAIILSSVMAMTAAIPAFAADEAVMESIESIVNTETLESIDDIESAEDVELEKEEAEPVLEDTPDEEEAEMPVPEEPEDRIFPTGYISEPEFKIGHRVDEENASFYEEMPAKYITEKLPSLQDQSPYGTCWAFASLGLMEINLMKEGIMEAPDLSELHLSVFFLHTVLDPLGGTEGDYMHCRDSYEALDFGGNFFFAMNMMTSWVGAADESLMPYETAPMIQAYGINDSNAREDISHLQDYYLAEARLDWFRETHRLSYLNPVKKLIYEQGAVGVSFGAVNSMAAVVNEKIFNAETGAYYNPNKVPRNHGVVAVGWDDNFPKENFATKAPGDGAFLIRNSWSEEGSVDEPAYDGYFWMSYYEPSLVDSFFAVKATTAKNYNNNYQYDYMPTNGYEAVKKGSNIFTAHAADAKDGEVLRAVSVMFMDEDTDYTVEVYTDLKDPMDPESGTREDSATVTGRNTFSGCYTIPLNDDVFLAPGTTFSVVVTCEFNGLCYELSTDNEVDWADGIALSISAHEGESFSYEDGKWETMPHNLKIKAYTDNVLGDESVPESIRLNNIPKEGLEIGIDERFKVNYSVLPLSMAHEKVTWTSSDPKVAKVEDGFVIGLKSGTAHITVATENGLEASFDVTVSKKLKDLFLNLGSSYYQDGKMKMMTIVETDPEDYVPEGEPEFSSSDPDVISVDKNGILTFNDVGVAFITVKLDGVKDSIGLYGRYPSDEALIEVKKDNTVVLKWTPKEKISKYTIYRGDEILAKFEAMDGISEYVDDYYARNPDTGIISAEYTIGMQVGEYEVPLELKTKIYPIGEEPEQLLVSDWGDVKDPDLREQFEEDYYSIPTGVWYAIDGKVYLKGGVLEGAAQYTSDPVVLGPYMSVYCGNHLLTEGKDYTLSYKNNVNATGEGVAGASVTVTGKGGFNGSATFSFAIARAELDRTKITSEPEIGVDITKKTKLSSIVPTVTYGGRTLKAGTDYDVVYYKYIDEEDVPVQDPSNVILTGAGESYTAVIKAADKKNFTGEYHAIDIETYDPAKTVNAADFVVGDANGKPLKMAYEDVPEGYHALNALFDNSEGKKASAYVFYKGKELKYDEDYTLEGTIAEYKKAGTHTFVVTGRGDGYVGSKTATIIVEGYDISKAKVAGLLTNAEYQGRELTIDDFFNPGDRKLEGDWTGVTLYKMAGGKIKLEPQDEDNKGDYIVELESCKEVGKYTVTFRGINGCCGVLKKTLNVKPYDIKKDSKDLFNIQVMSARYSKAGAQPKVEVTFGARGGRTLVESVDYTLTYSNNKKICNKNDKDAAYVTVKGIGNYKGSAKSNGFTIYRGNVQDIEVSASDVVYREKGSDGYFLVIPKLMECGKRISIGKNKDLEAGSGKDFVYTYAEEAKMADGTTRAAGEAVQKTDRPLQGTVIRVSCSVSSGEKSSYAATENQLIAGTYRIYAPGKDISKCAVSLAGAKKISLYYNDILAEDLVVTIKADGSTRTLVPKVEYAVESVKVDKAGKTATVVIRGLGEYGGRKTLKIKLVEGL